MAVTLAATVGAEPQTRPAPTGPMAGFPGPEVETVRLRGGGETYFRGRLLRYEVIDGLAIHGGDMVLGSAADVSVAARMSGPSKAVRPPHAPRRDLSAVDARYLWPDGVVPFVIDRGVTGKSKRTILDGIAHWNERTVIRLVERVGETDYVRFRAKPRGICSGDVGRVGGAQSVNIPPNGCNLASVIHEIGHAVGLWHEHQREDRDGYVSVLFENLSGLGKFWYAATHPSTGPYDYASVMHYPTNSFSTNRRQTMETVPPGMGIPYSGLSAGDIDGVAKLYGRPSAMTTVSTNPPGLELIVDGQRVTAPNSFRWHPGSEHVIEAPLAQLAPEEPQTRYVFGRWNDHDGGASYAFTARPDRTWIEANFIVQHQVLTDPDSPFSGAVAASPPSPDNFYTARSAVTVSADPRGQYKFLWWGGESKWAYEQHGVSTNPAPFEVTRPAYYQAVFTSSPLFTIRASAGPVRVDLDTWWNYTPINLAAKWHRQGVTVAIADRLDVLGRRFRFEGWSDGKARSHRVEIASGGGSLVASVVEQHRLWARAVPEGAGTVSVHGSHDGALHDHGTSVTVTADPAPGWQFAEWTGDAAGELAARPIYVDAQKYVAAVFTRSERLSPGYDRHLRFPPSRLPFQTLINEDGFRVYVPRDATRLTLTFKAAAPGSEVDLHARHRQWLGWAYAADGRTPVIDADFSSAKPGSDETITVTPYSTPPLEEGVFYIGLVSHRPAVEVQGTLRAQIRRDSEARPYSLMVTPRALTFVSPEGADPAPQVAALQQGSALPTTVAVDSKHGWLAVSPGRPTLVPGAPAAVSVSASTAGLAPGAYRGSIDLRVGGERQADGAGPRAEAAEIRVNLVVIPADWHTVESGQ